MGVMGFGRLCDSAVFVGICVLLLAVPLAISGKTTEGTVLVKAVVAQVIILLMGAVFVVGIALRGRLTPRASSLALPLVLMLATSALSLVGTSNTRSATLAMSQLVAYGVLMVIIGNALQSVAQVRWLFGVMVTAGLLTAVYGLCQHWGYDFLQWDDTGYATRYGVSFFGNQNFAVQFLGLTLPVAVTLALVSRHLVVRTFSFVGVMVILAHLSISRVRSGMVSLAVSLVLFAILAAIGYGRLRSRSSSRKQWRPVYVVVVVAVCAVCCVVLMYLSGGSLLGTTVTSIFDPYESNNLSRLVTWSSTSAMIRQHPLLGVGLGDYGFDHAPYWSFAEREEFIAQNVMPMHAHNEYLETGAESGLPGLWAFLLLFAVAAVSIWRSLQRASDLSHYLLLVGIAAALCAVAVSAVFTFNLKNPATALYFWTLLGIVSFEEISSRPARSEPGCRISHVRIWLAAIVAVCLIACVPLNLRMLLADVAARKGQVFAERGDYEEAEETLGKAVATDSAHLDALFSLGVVRGLTGDHKGAVEAYERLLSKAAYHPSALSNIGYEYLELDQPERAEHHFRESLSLVPEYANATRGLALACFKQGELEEATALYESLRLLVGEDPVVLKSLARCYSLSGDYQKARECFSDLVEMDPDDAVTREAYARLMQQLGDTEGAVRQFRHALKIDPCRVDACRALVTISIERAEHIDAAVSCLSEYVACHGKDRALASDLAARLEASVREQDEATITSETRAELDRLVRALKPSAEDAGTPPNRTGVR